MGTTLNLADGEEFVEGRSQETAARLVTLAKEAGLSGSVKTTYNGYIVPSAIFDADADAEAQKQADAEAAAEAEARAAAQAATEAEADKNAAESKAEDNPKGVEYDPSTPTVDEVRDYLANANDEERARVLEAEAASAKPRKGILDLATIAEGAK
jgi:hypothetical protein